MKRIILVVGCIVLLAMAIPSWATLWDFGAPTVPQENTPVGAASWAVTQDGITLTAYGFDIAGGPPNNAHELYFKNEGVDEHGLGLVGTLDKEITLPTANDPANYIQFDLQNILAASKAELRMQSVTTTPDGDPEGYDIWGSNTLGSLGTQLLTNQTTNQPNFLTLPNWGLYRYYSVSATTGLDPANNVLPDAIRATVPEPGTMGLLLMGLPALGLLRRKYAK